MKKILILFSLFWISLSSVQSVLAADSDNFELLNSKLEINGQLPPEIQNLANRSERISDSLEAFGFESSIFSIPHVVRVESGSIVYIALTIPPEEQVKYFELMKSLGQAEILIDFSDTRKVVGYPAQGLAFILTTIDGYPVQMIKMPPQSVDAFAAQWPVEPEVTQNNLSSETEVAPAAMVAVKKWLVISLVTLGGLIFAGVAIFFVWAKSKKTR